MIKPNTSNSPQNFEFKRAGWSWSFLDHKNLHEKESFV